MYLIMLISLTPNGNKKHRISNSGDEKILMNNFDDEIKGLENNAKKHWNQ